MVAIAMALLWGGYTSGLYGYILIRGYNVSFKELVSPTAWYSGKWPPPLISDPNVILPGGTAAAPAPGGQPPSPGPGPPGAHRHRGG